ncbi:MAG: hypothetical protein VXX36_04085 [Verrucomicrobiota bacterium]|nr:hypothetical protein [Verrucomicrobiota bacterium]
MADEIQRDLGLQPIDQLMKQWGVENHELVEVSTEQLTHKQVQKARKGRRVTINIQRKIFNAIRKVAEDKELDPNLTIADLFNYRA